MMKQNYDNTDKRSFKREETTTGNAYLGKAA